MSATSCGGGLAWSELLGRLPGPVEAAHIGATAEAIATPAANARNDSPAITGTDGCGGAIRPIDI